MERKITFLRCFFFLALGYMIKYQSQRCGIPYGYKLHVRVSKNLFEIRGMFYIVLKPANHTVGARSDTWKQYQ